MNDIKLTSVKVMNELYNKFKILCFDNKMTLQKLTNRALHLYTQTLLHELWHVYQHVKGDLKDRYGKRCWKGVDHSKIDYENQPWEKEAVKMEKVLVKKYKQSC